MPSTKSEKTPKHSWQFEALGTYWEIVSSNTIDGPLRARIEKNIEAFDATYSRFREDSLVRKMAQASGVFAFPEDSERIFLFYDELFALTEGKVTPLVGSALSSAGYDETYTLKPQAHIQAIEKYPEIVQHKNREVEISKPTLIDIGAVGKGNLVDTIYDLLIESGHRDFVVDGSGDMRVAGELIETVGLENPHAVDEVIGVVELKNRSLCASASNRRAWGDWHHIIDTETLKPTREIIATWAVADSAMTADGLATALFFVEPHTLASKYNYDYMRMHADGSIEYSDYFAGGIFS